MTALTRVRFAQRWHPVRKGASVLDALLEAGEPIAHACRAGVCGACLLRVSAGEAPAAAQIGLPQELRALGYVYACQCRPEGELSLEPPGPGLRVGARVVDTAPLSGSVTRVRLALDAALPARAGQYLTVHRDGVARSYSIAAIGAAPGAAGDAMASAAARPIVELHVRHLPGGQLSPYLCEHARAGDALEVQGPQGRCFYLPELQRTPLLLIGAGTGLAPLWGVLHDALANQHAAPIYLLHGAAEPSGLYLVEELRALAARHPTLRYQPCALRGAEPGSRIAQLPLDAALAAALPSTRGVRALLCGDAALVAQLQRQVFLAGASLHDITSDAFLAAPR